MLDVRRHIELFDPSTFNKPVTVIGAGATGSWLVMMLAKLGITNITVYDFDVVEEHNVPNQFYGIADVGTPKTLALKINVFEMTGTDITTQTVHFDRQRVAGIVFLMVDSMAMRNSIWQSSIKLKPSVELLIEPRMGLDLGRVYVVNPTDLNHVKQYENTYYSDEESEVSACGSSQSVITTAVTVASWCARQLINFHTLKEEIDNEIVIDLKYNNIMTTRW